MAPNRLPMTKALRTMVATVTGKPCGLGTIPNVGGVPAEPPYSILYALEGSLDGPPFGDANADAEWTYQVTSVGERDDQAQWLADKVRAAILSRTSSGWTNAIPVSGMKVIGRAHAGEGGTDAAEVVSSVPERYTLWVAGA